MTELERAAGGGTMPDKLNYAKALADSGLLPQQYRKQPANLLYAIEYAEMLGLPPMAAITGIHVIDGKPTASAGLISGLVRRAGHRLRVSGDDTHAVAEIVRCDDPEFTFRAEWTIDRARQAGLLEKKGDTWQRYPAAMLKARVVTEVARDAAEEALSGMHYTPEELGAEVDEEGKPTLPTEPPKQDPPADKPAAAESQEETAEHAAQHLADSLSEEQQQGTVTLDTVRACYRTAQRGGYLGQHVTHPMTGDTVPLSQMLTATANSLPTEQPTEADPKMDAADQDVVEENQE